MNTLKEKRNIVPLVIAGYLPAVYSTVIIGKMGIRRYLADALTGDLAADGIKLMIGSVLSIVCAIVTICIFWGVVQDINTVCRPCEQDDSQHSPNYIVVLLLSVITLGIYMLYWIYKQGRRMQRAGQGYQIEIPEGGGMYLLFELLGILTLGICHWVYVGKLFKNLNRLSAAYNHYVSGAQMNAAATAGSSDVTVKREENEAKDDVMTVPMSYSKEGHIEGIRGMFAGADIEVANEEEIIIGRDESCSNLVIKNERVSRKHCGVRYVAENGTYVVTDYSKNGVYYKNGQRMPSGVPTMLQAGTIIVITDSGNEFLLK